MADRVGPPSRPPTVRAVARDLDAADRARPDGLITHGSRQPPTEHRHVLAPWQRDTLMVLASRAPDADRSLTPQPRLLRLLADVGLVAVEEMAARLVKATITERGREALARGWYPA